MAKTMKAVIELGGKLDGSLLKSMSSAEKRMQSLSKVSSGIGKVVSAGAKAAALATAAAGAAAVKFTKDSIEVGKSFDSSMAQVAATMGKTVDEVSDLREFAKEMGATTAFSASQAADALNYMALAGYDSEKSMAMLPNVLNLAAAGGMELATASDMVTDASSALGLTTDETTQLVDKMAQAASKSNTSVSQLGEAILTVGGTAKNLAGGTTELSQALGLLADNGIKGSEGGTALRNVILSLSAPTDKAAAVLNQLGVEAFDADGNLRPLQDTFADLGGALGDLTQQEQTEALNNIFNKVDLKSVNALLGTSADRWNELAGAIDNSKGAAEQMAATQLDNLEGDLTMFGSALEGVQIAFYEGLSPALREFVQLATEGLGEVNSFLSDSGAMDTIAGIAAGISGAVRGVASGIREIGAAFMQGIDLDGLSYALAGFGDAMGETFSEGNISLTQLVGSALASMVNTTIPLITSLQDVIRGVAPVLQEIFAAVMEVMPAIAEICGSAFEIVKGIVEAVWPVVSNIIVTAVDVIKGAITGISSIVSSVASTFNAIKSAMTDPISAARDFLAGIPGQVIGFFSGLGGAISNAIGSIHFPTPHISWNDLPVGPVSIPIPTVQWYAKGGFTNGPVIVYGEKDTEAVISFDPRYRSDNIGYWMKAGQMLGVVRPFAAGGFTTGEASALSVDIASPSGSLAMAASSTGSSGGTTIEFGSITFAPQVTVSGDDSGDVMAQLRAARDEFFDFFDDYAMERGASYASVF